MFKSLVDYISTIYNELVAHIQVINKYIKKQTAKFSHIFHSQKVQIGLIVLIGVATIPLTVLALNHNTTYQQHAATIYNLCSDNNGGPAANPEGICGAHGWGYCTTSSKCNTQYFTYSGPSSTSACRGYDDNSGCCYPKSVPGQIPPKIPSTNRLGECSQNGTGMCLPTAICPNSVAPYKSDPVKAGSACLGYYSDADKGGYVCCYVNPTNRSNQTSCNSSTQNPPNGGSGNPPQVASSNPAPIGYLDGIDCNAGIASGWSCDASNFSQPLEVDFYLDGGAGSGGTGLGSVSQANVSRESGVGAECGGNSSHGFQYQLPSSVYDGKQHTLYAYGINIPSDPNANTLLTNSGMSFTCAQKTPLTATSLSPTAIPLTATPVPSQADTLLNIAVQLPGIGGSGGNLSPKHPTRKLHVSIYAVGADPTQPNLTPLYDNKNVSITFNSTNGYFTNARVDVGKLPTGTYQILFKSPGYLRKEVINPTDQSKTMSITGGTINPISLTKLIPGDVIASYNVLDIADYYAILGCFLDKANTASCTAGSQITDLNDDGVVDGADLNYWLLGMNALLQSNPSNPGRGDGVTGD